MTQEAHLFEKQVVKTLRLKYLLFLPQEYASHSDKQWPLILFLHGAGERGDDLNMIKKHGIPKVVEERPDLPFITVSPQCPEESWWTEQTEALSALLDEIVNDYPVDRTRIYLTGLSMGGYGTWSLALREPERFAAIAPICGGLFGPAGVVSALKEMPIWAFHGAKDPVVPIEQQERLVRVLQECGGNIRFTVYPEAEHDSWTETYNNPALYEWFLEHSH